MDIVQGIKTGRICLRTEKPRYSWSSRYNDRRPIVMKWVIVRLR